MTSSAQSEPAMRSIQLSVSGSSIAVEIFAGKPVYVLGRNGTGKSALMHTINTQASGQSIYLLGSRSLHFDNESLSLTVATRRQLGNNFEGNDRNVDTRWRPLMGTSRNEEAFFDLQNIDEPICRFLLQ